MPPLAGPRLMLCCTRQPVKTWTEPSSMRTGKWTVSSRLTSRRPCRASSERPMTSAAASKRRCAVWKAEERISTAIWRLPIVTPGLRGWSMQNCLNDATPRRHVRADRARRPGHRVRARGPDPGAAAHALQPARPLPGPGSQRPGARSDQRRRPPADCIAVNGRRITPLTAFAGSEGQIVIDQGAPFTAPVKVAAVGDRNRMQEALDDPSALPDIRARQVQFQVHLTFEGSPNVSLPAYDSSLRIPHVSST